MLCRKLVPGGNSCSWPVFHYLMTLLFAAGSGYGSGLGAAPGAALPAEPGIPRGLPASLLTTEPVAVGPHPSQDGNLKRWCQCCPPQGTVRRWHPAPKSMGLKGYQEQG